MLKFLNKGFLIAVSVFLLKTHTIYAQTFYSDYKAYLMNNAKRSIENKKAVNLLLTRLTAITDKFRKEKGRSFFASDTVYLVNSQGLETGFLSGVIWNKKFSGSYRYSYSMADSKKTDEKLEIQTDASSSLAAFKKEFRNSIESGDTVAYLSFANKHRVLDGEFVSALMAVKKNNHWKFISFKDSGGAIGYDF